MRWWRSQTNSSLEEWMTCMQEMWSRLVRRTLRNTRRKLQEWSLDLRVERYKNERRYTKWFTVQPVPPDPLSEGSDQCNPRDPTTGSVQSGFWVTIPGFGYGLWTMDHGYLTWCHAWCKAYFGLWTLGHGSWTLRNLMSCMMQWACAMGFGSWIMGYGLWVLNYLTHLHIFFYYYKKNTKLNKCK